MNELFESLLEWLAQKPTIGYLLFALIIFAGPEKALKLLKDYCRSVRRARLWLVGKGWWFQPKIPILLVEGDPPDSWNLFTPQPSGREEDHRWFWATSSALSSHVHKELIYDIWVNHESLRKRDRYKQVYWRFVRLEQEGSTGRYLFEADSTLAEIKVYETNKS